MDPHTPYFNAGVMIINLDHWRKEEIAEKCLPSIPGPSAAPRHRNGLGGCMIHAELGDD